MEVVTNESDPLFEAGETGPTLLQRVGVAVDADDPDVWCGLEDAERVPRPSERRVDDDSAICPWPIAEPIGRAWEAREE